MRSGAALVEAMRQLKAMLRKPDEEEPVGVDTDCIAFSCCWCPDMAHICVHWYKLSASGLSTWHMNLLDRYLFMKDDDVVKYRHDIYDILDWVCGPERREMNWKLRLELEARKI